jgi:hypothetical protein
VQPAATGCYAGTCPHVHLAGSSSRQRLLCTLRVRNKAQTAVVVAAAQVDRSTPRFVIARSAIDRLTKGNLITHAEVTGSVAKPKRLDLD